MSNAISVAPIVLCCLACAPRFQTQVVAANRVSFTQPITPGTLVAELPVAEASDDDHTLRYAVHLPRALELDFVVTCPGAEARGTLGETFEAYRQRRLAELEEQRRRQAALVGSIVGAAVPRVQAGAQVAAPGVQGSAQATVDPGQAAASAAYGMSSAQLPPGDVGAQTVEGAVDLGAVAAGSCFLTLENRRPEQDVSGVAVDLALDRTVDLVAEEEARIAAEEAQASELAFGVRTSVVAGLAGAGAAVRTAFERQQLDIGLRGAVVAELLAAGADPGLRARERAAAEAERVRLAQEEQVRLQAELALQAERLQVDLRARQQRERTAAEARVRAEESIRLGLALRVDLQGYLIALGADPLFRMRQLDEAMRLEDQARAEELRLAAEARARDMETFRLGMTIRGNFAGYLVGLGADPDHRRWEAEQAALAVPVALGVRDDLVRVLISLGADPTYRQQQWEEEQRLRVEQAMQWEAELDAGLALRELLRWRLVALGAVERPPMPPAPVETVPPAPFAGAVWIDGGYVWRGGSWIWVAGQWTSGTATAGLQLGGLTLGAGGALVVPGGSVSIEVGAGTH